MFERRTPPTDGSASPVPVMLEPAEGRSLVAWCDRHDVRPGSGGLDLDAGYVDLASLWSALVRRAEALGLEIVWGRRVLGARVTGGALRAARTDAGEHEADALVVAAGAEAVGITPALGVQLPVIPEWSAWMGVEGVDAPAGWFADAASPAANIGSVHLDVLWSDGSGRGVVGAFRSFGSTGARRDALAREHLERVARRQPAAVTTGPVAWRLHAHTRADHRPVVGLAPRAPSVVLALPHGPFGNARAVEIVSAACDAVTALSPVVPHAWSPSRFPQGATGGRMEAAR